MTDYSEEIAQLEECKTQFDSFGQRLFELFPDVTEEDFSIQEMFAIAAKIIYVRKRISDIVIAIKDRLEDEGDYLETEEAEDMMDNVQEAFAQEDDLLPSTLIEDIAVFRRSNLAISVIERYQDILLSLVWYCTTGERWHLQKKFREIPLSEM